MKKIAILAVALAAFATSYAQGDSKYQYRRSSLATIMLDTHDGTLEKNAAIKQLVVDTYNAKPTPDKYNDHNLSIRAIDVNELPAVTADEAKAYETGNVLVQMAKSSAGMKGDGEYIAQLMKYFKEKKVANQLVAKWFDIDGTQKADGTYFTMNLITERGLAGYSAEEINEAKTKKGGQAKLIDGAITDLVPQTFVAVTNYSFMSGEELMELTLGTIMANMKSSNPMVQKAAELAYNKAKESFQGYFVHTKTYLFQLDWSEKQFEELQMFLMNNDPAKINEMLKSDAFAVKYVGKTSKFAPATLTISLEDKSKELIGRATLRSTDAVIAKLQQEYEVFKTLAPLYVEGEDITALIGMNEGLEGGEKFEVLQPYYDENGKTAVKVVDKITVMKGKVWDNRAGAEGEAADLGKTYFKGKAKKLYTGLFIRQIK